MSHLTIDDLRNAKLVSSKSVVNIEDMSETEKEQIKVLLVEEWSAVGNYINWDFDRLFTNGIDICYIKTWLLGDHSTILTDIYYILSGMIFDICGAIFLSDTTNRLICNHDDYLSVIDKNEFSKKQVKAFQKARDNQ
jgi:hypothetical protein